MATVFTRIIEGELPGRFVWRDEQCVAFLSINPIADGHVLVVPRSEVEHWIDLEQSALDHLMAVSRTIGQALQREFRPQKVGLMLAGLEVPHVHIHLIPVNDVGDMDFANADPSPDADHLDAVQKRIAQALA